MEIDDNQLIRQWYLLEKRLAHQILSSSRHNRTEITIEAYDELFSQIPWHPALSRSAKAEQENLEGKWIFFGHLLGPHSNVLEIGTGNANLTRFLAQETTGRCAGIDISKEVLTRKPSDPPNLELHIMDAVELDFPTDTFDLAISDQLIEHLHPDDVGHHFARVCHVLKENGVYGFRTPSRLDGPHDVSRYFDDVATGFHLKEWTYGELVDILRQAGFKKMRTMIVPYGLARRSSLARSLGTIASSLLNPSERLVEKVKDKQVRKALCKWLRISSINIIAGK
jgi:SAM-dependent methyltransferase